MANPTPDIDRIDQCLPQTQCTLCTYPRCRDYAAAIAAGEAGINQCPPGGDVTIRSLAELLDKPLVQLDESHGVHEPKVLAKIREAECIGCKLCIKACPVDCIVGAAKRMHTVISRDCTGCKLCVPVCPTDCIDLVQPRSADSEGEQPSPWSDFSAQQVARARVNTEARLGRIARFEASRQARQKPVGRSNAREAVMQALQRKNLKSD